MGLIFSAHEKNTDAWNLRLLRLSPSPTHYECDDEGDNPTPFSILDPSTQLRTGFRFSIVGLRIEEPNPKYAVHVLDSLNPKSKI
jgi:hypothetical protein